jgi:hypothetical protein
VKPLASIKEENAAVVATLSLQRSEQRCTPNTKLKQQLSALQDETDDASAGDILQRSGSSPLQQWKPAAVLGLEKDDVTASSTTRHLDALRWWRELLPHSSTGVLGQDQGPNQLQQQQQQQQEQDGSMMNGGKCEWREWYRCRHDDSNGGRIRCLLSILRK